MAEISKIQNSIVEVVRSEYDEKWCEFLTRSDIVSTSFTTFIAKPRPRATDQRGIEDRGNEALDLWHKLSEIEIGCQYFVTQAHLVALTTAEGLQDQKRAYVKAVLLPFTNVLDKFALDAKLAEEEHKWCKKKYEN